jgi:carbamoyltransferase
MTDRAVDFADNAFGFHFPATIHLLGRSMPCYLVNHHATHAAAYYLSGNRSGAILTTDGGSGRERGGWWNYAVGSQIMPIAPHFLEVGGLYSQTAIALLKLGSSAEGKMMGLAPYGQPTMFEDRLVGNGYTYDALACQGAFPASEEKRYGWERFARARVSELGYNLSDFGNPERPLDPVNADLAASVQQIIEASLMNASVALANLLKRRDVEVDGLCLAGGSMLNCPTNTRIYESKLFKDVFIPPCTEDSGCAIGAALWVHHNLFGYPLIERCATLPADPYVGMPVPAGTDKTIQQHAGIWFDHVDDAADLCAADLCQNRVVAWFEGRSEIGPRALGHRSILADPRVEGNWQRVNEVKHRATWRPFAPAVLKEHSARYFEGAPANSPYMLFNARVKSKSLPAVTHVDGTSRIQTVTRENGQFHSVIDNFYKMTGCPAVMNTSLNGPGEPIIETPLEALRFIANGYADVLYIDNFKVVPAVMRKPAPPPAS